MGTRDLRELNIRELFFRQKVLLTSGSPRYRLAAAFAGSSALTERLNGFSDRQIAQLVLDVVWNELAILSGELLLVEQATKRLFRSKEGECSDSGLVSVQTAEFLCNACGSEMLPNVGIDEPDFWQCTQLKCSKKVIVG